MLQIRKILFPTDFSVASTHALAYAVYLARQYGAELHMLHVMVLHAEDPYNPAHHFPDVTPVLDRLRRRAQEDMTALTTPGTDDDLAITHAHRRAVSAAPAIVEYVDEQAIDLVVISTHGRRGLRRLLLGSVTGEVVRLAPCPVLTIRYREGQDPKPDLDRILVPIDFSAGSEEALNAARNLAGQYKASLQLLHVLEDVLHPAFYQMGVSSIKDLQPDIEEKAEIALRHFYEQTEGPKVAVGYHVTEGHAGRDITTFAQANDSDLIVISTHGLSALEQLLIGSVTDKVVRRADCPVLVLKTYQPGHEE